MTINNLKNIMATIYKKAYEALIKNKVSGNGLTFKIKDGSVTSDKLADGAISADKLADGAISLEKIDSEVWKSFGKVRYVTLSGFDSRKSTGTLTSDTTFSTFLPWIKDGDTVIFRIKDTADGQEYFVHEYSFDGEPLSKSSWQSTELIQPVFNLYNTTVVVQVLYAGDENINYSLIENGNRIADGSITESKLSEDVQKKIDSALTSSPIVFAYYDSKNGIFRNVAPDNTIESGSSYIWGDMVDRDGNVTYTGKMTGDSSKLYVDLLGNKMYRFNGSAWVALS